MKKLAIITTHPIQYNAPLFRLLSKRSKIKLKVFYTWGKAVLQNKFDPGFNRVIEWDIPLLDGYEFEFTENKSVDPGSHHFNGIINPSLIPEIENWKADAVLVYGWSFKSHLQVMRHFKGKIPVWFRGDSTLLDDKPGFNIKKIIRRIALKWVYSHIDKALYVGSANKEYFLKHGLRKTQLELVPHVVDNNRFAEPNDYYQNEAILWRSRLGISKSDFVFLFAGKLEEKKNPEILIRAFKKIDLSNTHLVIAGNGKLEVLLKANYGDIKNMHFVDFQNQTWMPILYRLAEVFVLPSEGPGETWGLAVNEAMACKKAILVSNKSGCAMDLIDNGVNGFTFQSNDFIDLVSKMNLMCENASQIQKMGMESMIKIQKFNQQVIAKSIENLVLDL